MQNPHIPLSRGRSALSAFLRFMIVGAALTMCASTVFGQPYPWQQPQATVIETGDLEWAPEPFVYEEGSVVRYIDYESGDDANAGTQASPWKHLPYDDRATGNSIAHSGVTTYVLKRGVTYRLWADVAQNLRLARLTIDESGTSSEPIRITSDPNWGTGEATITGAVPVDGFGGTWQIATATDIPNYMDISGQTIWYIDINHDQIEDSSAYSKSSLNQFNFYEVESDGTLNTLYEASNSDWRLTNPNFSMHHWNQWDGTNKITADDVAADPTLKEGKWYYDADMAGYPDDFFVGGKLWSQWAKPIGTPIAHTLELDDYYSAIGGFQHRSGAININPGNRYLLSDLPQFLDAAGEFYYDEDYHPSGLGGRLFLRLPEDRDPGTSGSVVEIVAGSGAFSLNSQSHIEVSGLTFRGLNGSTFAASGNVSDVEISNCRFLDTRGDAISFQQDNLARDGFVMDDLRIKDNEFLNIHGGTAINIIGDGSGQADLSIINSKLIYVEILRNKSDNNGLYKHNDGRWSNVPAINLEYPERAMVAGNIVRKSMGSGIVIFGGKAGKDSTGWDIPLTRIISYNNKTEYAALGCNDYGALAYWQGGAIYSYNNVSGNSVGHWPGGFWNSGTTNLSYPLYHDGAFKIYNFNNILWARGNDPSDPYVSTSAIYFNVFGFLNPFVNNTMNGSAVGFGGTSGNRNDHLGNVMADVSRKFVSSNHGGNPSLIGGGDDASSGIDGTASLAYANNIFQGDAIAGTLVKVGRGAESDISADEIAVMAQQMQDYPIRLGTLGLDVGDSSPIAKPLVPGTLEPYAGDADFRLSGGGAAINSGVDYFIPWSLYATVGEWHFNRDHRNPEQVLDFAFYMTEAHINRSSYTQLPTSVLDIPGADGSWYGTGILENWIEGTLVFDGSRHAVHTWPDMAADITLNAADSISKMNGNLPPPPWSFDPPTGVDADGNSTMGEISVDGTTVTFQDDGDNWEMIKLASPVTVTANTMLEFTFNSPSGEKGKLHAIGLDDDITYVQVRSTQPDDGIRLYAIYGTEVDKQYDDNGLTEGAIFDDAIILGARYDTPGTDATYSIRLSDYPGYNVGDVVDRVTFVNDLNSGVGTSVFKDIKIYEDGQVPSALDLNAQVEGLNTWTTKDDTGVWAAESVLRFPGNERKTLDIPYRNILVDTVIKIDSGTSGAILGKHDGSTGYRLYVNASGQAVFEVSGGGVTGTVATNGAINDGNWYHILAEIDRQATPQAVMNIYVDGEPVGTGKSASATVALPTGTSLHNTADFVVGADNSLGNHLTGAIDFMRVSQGTLADAETDIAELYEWQTNGPVKYDFAGNAPVGQRDAGALEASEPYSPSGISVLPDLATGDYLLSWQDNSSAEDSFVVQRSTSVYFEDGTITEWTLSGADVESFTDDTAVSGTTYYYRVFAVSGSDTSPPSNYIKVAIGTEAPLLPDGIGFEVDEANNQIKVEWDNTDSTNLEAFPSSWTVKWTTTPGSSYSSAAGLVDHQYVITGIDPAQAYHIIIEAINGTGTTATQEFSVIRHVEDFTGVAAGSFASGWTISDPANGPVVATPPAGIVSPSATPMVSGGTGTSKIEVLWDAFDDLQYNLIEVVMIVEPGYGSMELRTHLYDDGATAEHVGRWSPNKGYLRTPNSGDVDFTPDSGETDATTAIDGGEAWTYRYMSGPASNGDPAYMDIYVQLLDESGNSRIDSNDVDEVVENWGILRNAPKPTGTTRGSVGILLQRDDYWIDSIKILPFVYPGVTFDAPEADPVTTRYEAEAFTAQDGTTTKTGNDSTGSFQDYGGSGTWIEWNNIDGGSGGDADLDINYAYGWSGTRYCDIYVNGETTPSISGLEFVSTGSWSSWSTVSTTVTLNSGNNTIKIEASPGSQGPNIDYMDVTVGGGGGVTVIAENDSDNVDEGGSKAVAVLDNDTNATQIDSFTQGSLGSVSQSGTELTYTPNLGVWSGTDNFDYTAGDGATSDTATVTMTINNTGGSDPVPTGGSNGLPVALEFGLGHQANRVLDGSGNWQLSSDGSGFDTSGGNDSTYMLADDTVTGDFDAWVQLVSLSGPGGSRMGLMLRDGESTGAEFIAIGSADADGYKFQQRTDDTGGANAETDATEGSSHSFSNGKWVLLQRIGDTVTVAVDDDNDSYLEETTVDISGWSDTLHVGLFVHSGIAGSNAVAEFDNYNLVETGGGTPVTTRYEAEAFTAQDGTTPKNGTGSTGSFQDYGGSGTWIEWNNIDGGSGGDADLDINYAMGRGGSRYCDIYVNGETTPSISGLEFANTGSWSSWSTVSTTVTLNSGNNTIKIEASPGSQGPNIDYMDVTVD